MGNCDGSVVLQFGLIRYKDLTLKACSVCESKALIPLAAVRFKILTYVYPGAEVRGQCQKLQTTLKESGQLLPLLPVVSIPHSFDSGGRATSKSDKASFP